MPTLRSLPILALLATAGVAPSLDAQVSAPAPPRSTATRTQPPALDRFESEIRQFETSDSASPPAAGGIVFVGSSSFRKWESLAHDFPRLPVLNRGFGGSTFPEALHYASRVVLPYRPREIVVYEGDNDLASGRTPRQVADDYRTFVRTVRAALPATRIVFVSIKPSPSRWALAPAAREANRLVRAIVAGDTLQSYVDVFTPMLGANGRPRPELFVSDSLHMTPAGYAIWRARIAPALRGAASRCVPPPPPTRPPSPNCSGISATRRRPRRSPLGSRACGRIATRKRSSPRSGAMSSDWLRSMRATCSITGRPSCSSRRSSCRPTGGASV
jgi:lysophospholipase L1-like esterase